MALFFIALTVASIGLILVDAHNQREARRKELEARMKVDPWDS